MSEIDTELYGKNFDADLFKLARQKTWQAVDLIAQAIKPGMSEKEAETLAMKTLRDMGARKFWHPVHIRFGANTLKGYREESEPDTYLAENDIFFIDIGPIFDKHEGDCGKTFTVGDDAALRDLAGKSKEIFDLVRADWLKLGLTGQDLWERACHHASALDVEMSPLYVKGHRISDFPHEAISRSKLYDCPHSPAPERWILEIQICDRRLGRGSFYEDWL